MVFTLEEFQNYEYRETASRMALTINFFCTGETKRLTFYQNIRAVNNFEPQFSARNYDILIPTPLPPGLDVTMFLLVRKVVNLKSIRNHKQSCLI